MDPAILAPAEIFRGLSAEQLVTLAAAARETPFDKGAVIFHEDDPGDRVFVIAWGQVRVSKKIPGIGEEALAILEPGTAFGEMMLLEDAPRSADAIAHTACILGTFERQALEQVLAARSDIAIVLYKNMGRILAHRLRETNEKLKAFFAMSSRW